MASNDRSDIRIIAVSRAPKREGLRTLLSMNKMPIHNENEAWPKGIKKLLLRIRLYEASF
jgi:hypothetical protein